MYGPLHKPMPSHAEGACINNSVKLWTMLCRATQDGWVIVESSDKMGSTWGGNGKPFLCTSCENPMNYIQRQKDTTPKDNPPKLERAQYTTGKDWRTTTISGKNEALGQSGNDTQLWMCSDESKIWCYKEQYCIGTWNVESMNQGKLDMVKQEMTSVNIHILGISELKWLGIGEFNSDDHYIHYCGQEFHRRNGVALIINKNVWNAVLQCNLRNSRMISVCFQGIGAIQYHSNPNLRFWTVVLEKTLESPLDSRRSN